MNGLDERVNTVWGYVSNVILETTGRRQCFVQWLDHTRLQQKHAGGFF